MYLYDKKSSRIDVYDLTPNADEIKAYRERELLSKIPYNETLYYAFTNKEKILEQKDIVRLEELNYLRGRKYHTFKADTDRSMYEACQLINNYINGAYTHSRVVEVLNNDNEVVKYLLVPFIYLQKFYPVIDIKHMDGIISIPKSLYTLQKLEQSQYGSILYHENLDELLQMFTLSEKPVDSFDYPNCGNCETNKELIESSQMILQRKMNL